MTAGGRRGGGASGARARRYEGQAPAGFIGRVGGLALREPVTARVRDSKFRDAGPRLAPAAQAWAGVVAYVSGSRTRG